MSLPGSASSVHLLDRWRQVFHELRADSQIPVADLYDESAVFEDPFRKVQGHAEIAGHFARLNENLRSCRFTHQPSLVQGDRAALPWTMHLDLRRGPRKTIHVEGVSLLRFAERVCHQRDVFDAGALVYENVPLLGAAVRFIKRRL